MTLRDGKSSTFQSTPLREGRRQTLMGLRHEYRFNPRPCARGDGHITDFSGGYKVFQSTPLREGRRRSCQMVSQRVLGFNPRPCARGDVF